MQKSLLSSLLIALSACASDPSPYITSCNAPQCERTAKTDSLKRQTAEGIEVAIDSAFRFTTPGSIKSITHQDDILILASEKPSKIASASLSLASFGLEESSLSAEDFLDSAFLKDFKALEKDLLTSPEIHSIRAIKLEAMSDERAHVYTQKRLKIYFYSENPSKHKAYIISKGAPESWVMLDFYDFSESASKKILSTISLF